MYATVSNSPPDSIQLTCNAGAVGTYYCSYITNTDVLMTQYGAIVSGPNPLVLAPAAGETNQVQAISIYGTPTSSLTVLIQYFDPASGTETLLSITLDPGFILTYTADGSGWVVLNPNGVRQG